MKAPSRTIIVILGLALLCLGGLLFTYREIIKQAIQRVAIDMRTTPFSSVIMAGVLIIASIPPVLGFTFAATITGFIYGFPHGIPPAVTGAFLGAMTCFGLTRVYNLERLVRLSPSKQEKYHAIQEAVEQGGLRIMLLIRLSPIPWPLTNLVLSLLPTISVKKYAIAALLGSFKLCLEVWVGSQLADLSNPDLPPSAHRVALLTMFASLIVLVAGAFWLYRLTMQKVKAAARDKQSHTVTASTNEATTVVNLPTTPSKKEM